MNPNPPPPTPDLASAPSSLQILGKGLDLTVPAGRLEFFARLTGGRDPDHTYSRTLTPAEAEWILSPSQAWLRIHNRARPLSSEKVKEYARRMLLPRGDPEAWVPNGGWPFTYTIDGCLANGFGRMGAVIVANRPIQFRWWGPHSHEFVLSLDRGHSRTAVDDCSLRHQMPANQHPSLFIDATKVIRHYLLGGPYPFHDNSSERLLLSTRYESAHKMLIGCPGWNTRGVARFRTPGVMAAFCYAHQELMESGHADKAAAVYALWDSLIQNNRLWPGTAPHTMYRHVMGAKNDPTTAHGQLTQMQRLIHGIIATISGRSLKQLEAKPAYPDLDNPTWRAQYLKVARIP